MMCLSGSRSVTKITHLSVSKMWPQFFGPFCTIKTVATTRNMETNVLIIFNNAVMYL